MIAFVRAPLTALAAAAILVSATANASAQSMDPAPAMTPLGARLIAPHNVEFKRNSADASPVSITRERWFGARGMWKSSTEDGMLLTRASFTGLVPGGHYSLFTQHTAGSSMRIRPLDQSGMTSSFVASPTGSAITTITLAQASVPGDEILLVYHPAGTDHPKTIGHLGVDAYIQLRLVQP